MQGASNTSAWRHPATALAALAVVIAIGGTAIAAQAGPAGSPTATASKALGTNKLAVRKAGVIIPAGGFQNGNYNSRTVSVKCRRGEVALSAGSQFPTARNNREMVTRFARVTLGRNGKPDGAEASGSTDLGTDEPFEVFAVCAG